MRSILVELTCVLLFLVTTKTTATGDSTACGSTGTRCTSFSSYCSSGYTFNPVCIDGYCRCPNTPGRDYCTCYAISGQCRIQEGFSSAVGRPTFDGATQTTYSCVANENCNYDVHVIGNYEGDGHTGFRVHNTGNTNVRINVRGQVYRPLVLVFVSYEPVNWILSISSGVTIEKVLLGSYYLDNSDVTYSSGSVRSVERLPYQTLPYGRGVDTGGGRTDEMLEYVVGRFGPVSSFSGSYRADAWTLNIQQQATADCHSVSAVPTRDVPTDSVIVSRVPSPDPFPSGLSRQCNIRSGSVPAVGTPTFDGESRDTSSCYADAHNCNYDIHVIGNYEGDGHTGFRVHNTGNTNVQINVRGQVYRPLVLVFVSYEPINWILSISSGVTIDKVLLGSYYLEKSSVTYSFGSVLSVERHSHQVLQYAYSDSGDADELLEYVVGRFGPVTSFSGSYRADAWTLNIQQRNYSEFECSQIESTVNRPPQPNSNSFTMTHTIVTSLLASLLFLLLLLGVIILTVACVMRVKTVEKEKTAYNEFDDPRCGATVKSQMAEIPTDAHLPSYAEVTGQQNQ